MSGTDNFISKAKRYTDIQELTPELLRLFIEKIVVHEKDVKWSKHARQTVEIHYTDIGVVGNMMSSQHLPILKICSCPCQAGPNGLPALLCTGEGHTARAELNMEMMESTSSATT